MKKKTLKYISYLLVLSLLCCGMTGCETDKEKNTNKDTAAAASDIHTFDGTAGAARAADPDSSTNKDETVYAITKADGSIQKIIVSDWISNASAKKELSDISSLDNIANVKGDETYQLSNDNAIVWDAGGDDIYYQGTTEEALPVTMMVTYLLDGKEISADELEGKSGKVTIKFDYTNNNYEMKDINGKQEKIYVPYVMLTGMLLDNEQFININVTNGKVVNDGNHTYVIGMAFPGMQEDLGISAEDMEFPSYVEFSADVTDFSLPVSMTLATSEILSSIDLDQLDSGDNENNLNNLSGSMSKLNDAMSQLLDGSSKLYDGLRTLLDNSDLLIDGVQKLADGAKQLHEGTVKLKDGTTQLDKGAASLAGGAKNLDQNLSTLSKGLGTLSANSDTLNKGAETLFNSMLASAQSEIEAKGLSIDTLTIDNYNKVLNNLISNPSDKQKAQLEAIATDSLNSKLSSVPDAYKSAAICMIYDQISSGSTLDNAVTKVSEVLTDAGAVKTISSSDAITADKDVYTYLLKNGYEKQTAGLMAKICTYLVSKNGGSTTDYIKIAAKMAENAAALSAAMSDTKAEEKTSALSLNLALDSLKSSISSLINNLDNLNQFYTGLISYTKGVDSAYSGSSRIVTEGSSKLSAGAATLASGVSTLANQTPSLEKGSNELYTGLNTLLENCTKLKDGVSDLTDGAMQLSDGLKEFNEDGIQKLSDLLDGDLGDLVDRLDATIQVAKNEKSFSGISDDMDGSVKYIYKMGGISE